MMKALVLVVVAAAFSNAFGCASAPPLSPSARDQLTMVSSSIGSVEAPFASTMDALEGVREDRDTDPRRAIGRFRAEMTRLESAVQSSRGSGASTETPVFAAWEGRINDAERTALANETDAGRQDAIRREFDGLRTRLRDARDVFGRTYQDLQNLDGAFAQDNSLSNLEEHLVEVRRTLTMRDDVIREFDDLQRALGDMAGR